MTLVDYLQEVGKAFRALYTLFGLIIGFRIFDEFFYRQSIKILAVNYPDFKGSPKETPVAI